MLNIKSTSRRLHLLNVDLHLLNGKSSRAANKAAAKTSAACWVAVRKKGLEERGRGWVDFNLQCSKSAIGVFSMQHNPPPPPTHTHNNNNNNKFDRPSHLSGFSGLIDKPFKHISQGAQCYAKLHLLYNFSCRWWYSVWRASLSGVNRGVLDGLVWYGGRGQH